jgi:hypothetical protein
MLCALEKNNNVVSPTRTKIKKIRSLGNNTRGKKARGDAVSLAITFKQEPKLWGNPGFTHRVLTRPPL